MEDALKRFALMGLGTVTMTREKIEDSVQKLVKKGELSAREGKKLAGKLAKDAERARKEIAARVEEGIKQAAGKAGFARKEEVKLLKARITRLENKVTEMEKRTKTRTKAGKKSTGGKKTPPKRQTRKKTSSGKKSKAKKG